MCNFKITKIIDVWPYFNRHTGVVWNTFFELLDGMSSVKYETENFGELFLNGPI